MKNNPELKAKQKKVIVPKQICILLTTNVLNCGKPPRGQISKKVRWKSYPVLATGMSSPETIFICKECGKSTAHIITSCHSSVYIYTEKRQGIMKRAVIIRVFQMFPFYTIFIYIHILKF